MGNFGCFGFGFPSDCVILGRFGRFGVLGLGYGVGFWSFDEFRFVGLGLLFVLSCFSL